MTARLSIAVLLAMLVSSGPAAAAELHAGSLGTATGPVVGDGGRWVAWQSDASTTRILDGKTGTATDVQTPDVCRIGPLGLGKGLTAVGGGQLAWTCGTTGTAQTYPTLLTLSTLTIHLPTGLAPFLQSARNYCNGPWTAVGARWARATCDGDKATYPLDFDWKTGNQPLTAPGVTAYKIQTLDTASRTRSVCSPVIVSRRLAEPGIRGFNGKEPIQSDGWVVGTKPKRGPLVMQRCGSKHLTTVSHCTDYCSEPRLSGGWLVWAEGAAQVPRARQVGSRKIGRTLRLANASPTSLPIAAGRLLVATQNARGSRQAVRVWRLPGAPHLPDL